VFLACAALLNRGDRVVIERPGYEPFAACARMAGAEIHRWERRFGRGYGLDRDAFAAAVPDGTKLVMLTNLHNPSGAFLEREEVRTLAEIAGRKGAAVFVDEIYLDACEPANRRTAFGAAGGISAGPIREPGRISPFCCRAWCATLPESRLPSSG